MLRCLCEGRRGEVSVNDLGPGLVNHTLSLPEFAGWYLIQHRFILMLIIFQWVTPIISSLHDACTVSLNIHLWDFATSFVNAHLFLQTRAPAGSGWRREFPFVPCAKCIESRIVWCRLRIERGPNGDRTDSSAEEPMASTGDTEPPNMLVSCF